MKTAVFPPPPLSTNRLSLSFSTSMILGAGCPPPPACRAATTNDSAPTPISTPRAMILFMLSLHYLKIPDALRRSHRAHDTTRVLIVAQAEGLSTVNSPSSARLLLDGTQ